MTGTELLDLAGKYAGVFVTSVLGAGVGAYVGSYLKKKGENLATHEDISKLVDQVAAVTQATRLIEARISNEVWDRQRKWEMKRDVVVQALSVLGDLEMAMSIFVLTHKDGLAKHITDEQAANSWNDALAKFKRSRILASLVCGEDANRGFGEFEEFIIRGIKDIPRGEAAKTWFAEFRARIATVIDLVRRDLTPLSTESSAAPSLQPF